MDPVWASSGWLKSGAISGNVPISALSFCFVGWGERRDFAFRPPEASGFCFRCFEREFAH